MIFTDNELPDRIAGLENKVYELATGRQPYLADWIQLPSNIFLFNTASIFSTSQSFTNTITVGDRVRWKNTGDVNYRYAYVVSLNANAITINAGDDYSIANNTITEFWYSKNVNPTGFPNFFQYQPTWSSDGTIGTITSTNDVFFTILGNEIRLLFEDLTFTTNSDTNINNVFMSLPFNITNSAQNTYALQKCDITDNFDQVNNIASLQVDKTNDWVAITHQFGFAVPMKPSTSNNVNIDISYYF